VELELVFWSIPSKGSENMESEFAATSGHSNGVTCDVSCGSLL
jgi:hypothetical protein